MMGEFARAGALVLVLALFAGTAWGIVRAALGHGSWSVLLLPSLACAVIIGWFWRVSRE